MNRFDRNVFLSYVGGSVVGKVGNNIDLFRG